MTKASPAPAEPVRKRRAYLPASERRRQIIAAAQRVFAESNLQGARTRDIAKAAEVNQATIFEHFESKEALFHEAVIEPLLEAMRGMEARAISYASQEEREQLAAGSAHQHLQATLDIFPLLTAALFSDLELGRRLYREQIFPMLMKRAATVAPLFKSPLDSEVVELATFGMLFSIAMDQTLGGKKRDLAEVGQQISKMMLAVYDRPAG